MADVAKLREILKTEYGISSMEELDKALKESAGLNIGIFTTPLSKSEEEM